jgi:prepilin-type N-terminal cleavage/methylation domain-containing protein
MRSRGFTLVEVLVALLILALVITTSLKVFYQRQQRLKAAQEMTLAYEALNNEGEVWRRVPYAELIPNTTSDFVSDPVILTRLGDPEPLVTIRQPRPDYKTVDLTVKWGGRTHSAALQLVRCETGGLW